MQVELVVPWISLAVSILTIVVLWTKVVTKQSQQIQAIMHQGNLHLELTGFIVGRQPGMSDADQQEMVRLYTSLAQIPGPPSNPLDPIQRQSYERYVQKAKLGEPFTKEEVEDFRLIAAMLHQEHPNDTGNWALLGLVALLVGLYILGKKE